MRYHDQHALIIGAGLDSLLAARMLLEHVRHVTLISPDGPPDPGALPQTIWQALPAHVLAVQGCRILERLFPGLTAELMVAGAPTVEWTADAVTLLPGGWAPRFHSDLISRPATTMLLAHLVRQRLHDIAGTRVTFLDSCALLAVQPGYPIVATVQSQGGIQSLTADLLVDASESHARLPDWLNRAGLPVPARTVIPGRLSLSARLYRRPPAFQPGWQAALILAHGAEPGGALIPIEGRRWLAICLAPEPPQDDAAFLNVARALPTPILYDAVQRGLPLTPVLPLPTAESTRWHFERLTGWPDTLLIMGAVRFNPAYGFDLTASALAALALKEALAEQRKRHADGRLNGLSHRFYERLARVCALPWLWMHIEGARRDANLGMRAARWYGDHLLRAARIHPQAYQALISVMGQVAPAYTLLSPALLAQVLRSGSASLPPDTLPPAFEPAYMHTTITQEMASVGGKERSGRLP